LKTEDSVLDPGQETLLDLKLDALRTELADIQAPAALEAGLRAHFRKTRPASQRPRLWWMPPLALAATIAMATWILRGPVPEGDGLVTVAAPLSLDGGADTPFVALRPLDRIAKEDGARIVTTEFPRALLADWGLPVAPDRAGEPVRAQMLYSARGEPLAVRLLN
jgi:hypothetical protein